MRIVIDMQGAQTESRFRGIGRYTMSLVKAIVKQAKNHEIFLVLNATMPESIHTIRKAFDGLLPSNRIRIFEIAPFNIWERSTLTASERIREHFISQINPDIILITSLFEIIGGSAVTSVKSYDNTPTAIVLYDLIPFIYPDKYLNDNNVRAIYLDKTNHAKNADLLLAISESSREEAFKYLNITKEKIINISGAVENDFFKSVSEKYTPILEKINKPYLLYTPGGFDERKNFKNLIEAFSLLPDNLLRKNQLVIVGKIGTAQEVHLRSLITANNLDENNVVLLGYVTDEILIYLYRTCKLFIFPSLHEGFGLPILEAMTCGAAVIASNNTSIPEIVGYPPALFDPTSVFSIKEKIEKALGDENFYEILKHNSLTQSKKFNWNDSAKKTLVALEQTVESSHLHRSPKPKSHITKDIASIKNIHKEKININGLAYSLNFNTVRETKHLLLDISTLIQSDAKSGIQRVVRSLLLQLLNTTLSNYEAKLIYFDKDYFCYADCDSNHKISKTRKAVDFRQDDIYLSLDLNMHLIRKTYFIHQFLNEHGILLYFIVYDILPLHYPNWWPETIKPMFAEWLENIYKVATGLICISNSVANDLNFWVEEHKFQSLSINPQIKSFHLGADVENSLPSKGLPSNAIETLHKIEKTTSFLMVGTVEPRKGYMQALNAFEILWRQGYDINLVIVGKDGWLADDLIKRLSSHPQKDNQLYWLKGISDEYLDIIYDKSTCLVAASEGEGFGLPLIEAAQHKIPIIARNLPVFREVAGDHAFYFDTTNPENLAQAIKDWLALHEKAQHPTSDTMPWLTWKDSAAQLVAAINLISGDHE